MSREEIAKQLRGSRTDVEDAAKAIQTQFKQIRNGAKSSVALYALNYEIQILRQLCCALQENLHKYADIYCNIAAELLPHVKPCAAKPEFWVSHLTSLQYIHHALCQEQTIADCKRFYALVNAQCCQLQSKTDYRFYLSMHVKHVYFFVQQIQKQATPAPWNELYRAMHALGQLFQSMLEQLHCPSQLMGELNDMLGRRSNGFLKIFATIPVEHTNKLFEPFFKLLTCAGSTREQLVELLPEYLSALLALLQLDGYAWTQQAAAQQQQPWALQLLRSCRVLYKDLPAQSYVLQLSYYYLKLLYTREATESVDFKRNYIDLGKKLINFFEQKCSNLKQEQWFIDFLMILVRLQRLLHQVDTKNPSFDCFWQALGGEQSAEAYAVHFALLESLINLCMNISRNSALASSCINDANCRSLRKHCIFSLGYCATAAYSNWQPAAQGTLSKASQKTLAGMMRYAMDVARATKCMTTTSVDIRNFVWHLANISDKATTVSQLCLVLQLLKPLQDMRPLLSAQEMRQLLRRICKASANGENLELAAQLQCTYIAAISCTARQFEQMCVYYRNAKNTVSCCVYELHERSPMCNPLSDPQKRQFYEMDMLAVLANKKTPLLLASLLRHRQTEYQMVILWRHLRTDKIIQQQFEELRLKLKRKQQRLSRLEQLMLGHASVSKLLDALEAQKTKIPIKETAEKSLEDLLVKNNLLDLNIGSEMPLLKLATTAIDAFEVFYERADAEFISSDDARIDWEALIDDVVLAAMAVSTMGYMQQADSAWLLLLRMGRLLGDRFTYMRALTHFMTRYTQHPRFDMAQEVAHGQQLMDELWPQLHAAHFFKRQHTTLLLCLCNMALYYARLKCLSHAQLLLLHAERLRDEFEERVGKCDIIKLTLDCVRFRMCYQQQHCNSLARMPTALQQLDTLAENVRNFASISSMDHGALILLLSDLVQDSTECTANRLSERPNLSSCLLQILIQSGLVLRTVQVLISWLWTNLRMECLEKALSKLRLIDHFLCIQPLLESMALVRHASKDSQLLAAPMDAQSRHMSELVDKMLRVQLETAATSVEPIRKQQQLALSSPRLNVQSSCDSQWKLQRYVDASLQEGHPVLRHNVQLQCIYFIVGCLHARLYHLNRNDEQLDNFYALATSWLGEDAARSHTLGHMQLLLQIYHANYLRANQRYQQAVEVTKAALKLASSEQLKHGVDINYRFNLLLQLRTAQLELQPATKLPSLRRALKFNKSPEEKPTAMFRETNQLTHVKKSQKFVIYTEDVATKSSSSSSNSRPKVDLNACQPIEIVDLCDDEQQSLPQLKLSKSVPRPTRITRARSQRQAETSAAPVERFASAPATTLTVSNKTKALTEETPKTTTSTRGRSRRIEQTIATPAPDSISTRRRQRN